MITFSDERDYKDTICLVKTLEHIKIIFNPGICLISIYNEAESKELYEKLIHMYFNHEAWEMDMYGYEVIKHNSYFLDRKYKIKEVNECNLDDTRTLLRKPVNSFLEFLYLQPRYDI